MDVKQKKGSGAQQAPSQAFVLTEAINWCTFAWTSPFWLQQHRVGQQPHWTWQQQYWGQHWHQHIPISRRRRRPPRMMRSTVSQSVGKKEREKGLILMHLAMVACWAPLQCWRCLGVEENRRRYLGNKAQALTENNQLNFFVCITWGISLGFHTAVVHAMVPPHDLTDDKVCSYGRGTKRSVGSLCLRDTTFRLHLKRALCLPETESTASPLFPSIAITFKLSHVSPLRTPTNSIHCQSMFSVLLEANPTGLQITVPLRSAIPMALLVEQYLALRGQQGAYNTPEQLCSTWKNELFSSLWAPQLLCSSAKFSGILSSALGCSGSKHPQASWGQGLSLLLFQYHVQYVSYRLH